MSKETPKLISIDDPRCLNYLTPETYQNLIDNVLPQEVDADWFMVAPEPIKITAANRHLININDVPK